MEVGVFGKDKTPRNCGGMLEGLRLVYAGVQGNDGSLTSIQRDDEILLVPEGC